MCIVKSLEELGPSEACAVRCCAGNRCVGEGVLPAHPFTNLSRWEELPRQPGQTHRTDHCCLQSSVHMLGRIKKNNSPFQESKNLFRNFPLIVRKIGCLEATHPSCQNLGWKKDQDSLGIWQVCVCGFFLSCSVIKKTESFMMGNLYFVITLGGP